jgi:hypothetical protein
MTQWVLDALERGELVAPARMVHRLEGWVVAMRALSSGYGRK